MAVTRTGLGRLYFADNFEMNGGKSEIFFKKRPKCHLNIFPLLLCNQYLVLTADSSKWDASMLPDEDGFY